MSARFAALLFSVSVFAVTAALAQTGPVNPTAAATAAERTRELALLGIKPEDTQKGMGAYNVGAPDTVNYDEAKANPYPIPDLLTFKNGRKVKTKADWLKRRTEIKAGFDEYVYGKYPAHTPKVTWSVTGSENGSYKGIDYVETHAVGHVDNSGYPAISIDIKVDVVTPAALKGKPVPVIIGGGTVHPRSFGPRPAPAPGAVVHGLKSPDPAPDSAELLLQHGMGMVSVNTNDVQADNGAGLDKGIIGLVNKGQPRKLDDWGVLRAWAWADSRAMDFLVTDKDVDGKKVGVMGHSRGGKAALVALVDDPRFAIGFISSSGAGGADLFRRNYGEQTANIAGNSEFHWFAGNFLRYDQLGHSTNEMPVDSHEFIALAAPRAVYIGGGALIATPDYAPGDAWQDAQGMFMAAALASPAWKFYGRQGLGLAPDQFPAMETFIDSGDIAFRQHPYGHTPAPNWPSFIDFAAKEFAKQKK